MAVRHRPRGWQWIDPEKEAKAAVISIQNGLGTRTGFLAEKGEDLEDVFAELAREQELAKEYGIAISAPTTQEAPAEQDDEEAPEDDAEKNGNNGRHLDGANRLPAPVFSEPTLSRWE